MPYKICKMLPTYILELKVVRIKTFYLYEFTQEPSNSSFNCIFCHFYILN